jgi:Glycosyl transferase family 2
LSLSPIRTEQESERAATMPLVSIVVPSYNCAATLRQSLGSIVAQTYPRTEVLVMEDGSTDATAAIADEFSDRASIIRQPRNRGQFANVNDGIERARGEYIAVYHADDVYSPRIVEREVEFLQAHPDVGAVFASDIFIDASGRELGRLALPPGVRAGISLDYAAVLNALLTHKNRFLRGPSGLVRREVYQTVGYFDPSYGIASDLEMWLRIARRYPLAVLDEHLFSYRRGHGSSSDHYHTLRTEAEGYFRILDEHLNAGARQLARPESMAAFEAHRAEDRLLRVVAHYILDQRAEARALLGTIDARRIIGSSRVQRGRLSVLWILLHLGVRIPRVAPLATRFQRRWHARISS